MPQPAREQWWDDVVSVDSVKLNDSVYLLWGDRVQVLETDGSRRKVHARGATGWVDDTDLGGDPVLELYFIDVGQGDGILVVTPEGHHILGRRWRPALVPANQEEAAPISSTGSSTTIT